jgi:hypothetical protein
VPHLLVNWIKSEILPCFNWLMATEFRMKFAAFILRLQVVHED